MKKKYKYSVIPSLFFTMLFFIVSTTIAQEKTVSGPNTVETPKFIVERLVIGTGVENLEPVGVADSFPLSTEKLYCFVEARNIAADTQITAVWFHGEKKMLETPLALKARPRWRTYAYKNLHEMTGTWRVEIRNVNKELVKDIVFKVE